MSLPVLYSFRRCPYAIRARMALFNADIDLDIHEVSLKNKPQAMLDVSSKGTVPVLITENGVIDESLDIMLWALDYNDPDGWYSRYSEADKTVAMQLITQNDQAFKPWLDKYKYADRHPEFDQDYYRGQCENYLQVLETALQESSYLIGDTISLADMAIFPFIRQFSMVDKHWFDTCRFMHTRRWLTNLLDLPLFTHVIAKTPAIGN